MLFQLIGPVLLTCIEDGIQNYGTAGIVPGIVIVVPVVVACITSEWKDSEHAPWEFVSTVGVMILEYSYEPEHEE